MTDAATLTALAAGFATEISAKAASPTEAIMMCGVIAARIAATADPKNSDLGPSALLKVLMAGFNAATAIETMGRIVPPNRSTVFGMAE